MVGGGPGGYTAALLSTLDARIGFAVFFIPLASIDTFAGDAPQYDDITLMVARRI